MLKTTIFLRTLAAVAAGLFLILTTSAATANPRYTVTRIGNISDLFFDSAKPPDMDDLSTFPITTCLTAGGDVLAAMDGLDPIVYHRGKWKLVSFNYLRWPDGLTAASFSGGIVYSQMGMNDEGDMIAEATGQQDGASLYTDSVSVLLRHGKLTVLPMPPGTSDNEPVAINNSYQILMNAGWLFDYRKHRFVSLGDGDPLVMNDRGDVVLDDELSNDEGVDVKDTYYLVVRRGGKTFRRDLGFSMEIWAINNNDLIVGNVRITKPNPEFGVDSPDATITTGCHAVIWKSGSKLVLPGLSGVNSQAEDVNDSGQVVGIAQIKGPGAKDRTVRTHAFLYAHERTMDLNTLIPATPRRELIEALNINRRGQILAADDTYLYLLTPK